MKKESRWWALKEPTSRILKVYSRGQLYSCAGRVGRPRKDKPSPGRINPIPILPPMLPAPQDRVSQDASADEQRCGRQ